MNARAIIDSTVKRGIQRAMSELHACRRCKAELTQPKSIVRCYAKRSLWEQNTEVIGHFERNGQTLRFSPDEPFTHVAYDYIEDRCAACKWPVSDPNFFYEGETAKSVFKAVKAVGTLEMLEQALAGTHFERRPVSYPAWSRRGPDFRQEYDRFEQLPEREWNIWFDDNAQEWVFKIEGQKKNFGRWCGWHDLGYVAVKTIGELFEVLKRYGLIY